MSLLKTTCNHGHVTRSILNSRIRVTSSCTFGPHVPKFSKFFTHWYRLLFTIFILTLCRSKSRYEYFEANVWCVGDGENRSNLLETSVWCFVV
jgi:hypothetical protein